MITNFYLPDMHRAAYTYRSTNATHTATFEYRPQVISIDLYANCHFLIQVRHTHSACHTS